MFHFLFLFFAVLTDGLPVVNKTCDVIFPGRTGKSKGYISSPNLSVPNEDRKSSNEVTSILKKHQGPLSCTSSFVPTDAQSVTITVGKLSVSNIVKRPIKYFANDVCQHILNNFISLRSNHLDQSINDIQEVGDMEKIVVRHFAMKMVVIVYWITMCHLH